jgi:hypothetical protein
MKLLAFPFLTLLLTAASALAQQKTVTIAFLSPSVKANTIYKHITRPSSHPDEK